MAEGLNVKGRTDKREGKQRFKSRSKSRSKSKLNIKCYHCHKEGHIRRLSPERKKGNQESKRKQAELAVVSDGYESSDALAVSSVDSEKEWILDSGCTFHMTPNKSWFEEFKQDDEGVVLLGNNKPCKVQGIVSVRIKMFNGAKKVLTQVIFIPELKRNLICLRMLDELEYLIKVESGRVMKGIKKNGIYSLLGSTVVGTVALVAGSSMNNAMLWHKRLGYVSNRGLSELAKQGLLGDQKLPDMEFCETCVFGKTCRVKFGSGVQRTKKTLDYIHLDIWGPFKT